MTSCYGAFAYLFKQYFENDSTQKKTTLFTIR
jgi:hypothetical protein